jgi:hypothetical protein
MENVDVVEELEKIFKEFKAIEKPTTEEIQSFKQREYNLFDKISNIRELCEYCKTDLTIDGAPEALISGIYSGVVNGAMFVIGEFNKILQDNETDDTEKVKHLTKTLFGIQGIGDFQ